MKGITHVFFDLDHTLWDYDFNARKVLEELYGRFALQDHLRTSKEGFVKTFFSVNAVVWRDFNQGLIEKDHIRNDRFVKVMKHCGAVDTTIANDLSDYFLYHCPRQSRLMEDAEMVLHYLSKKYQMGIITNGFAETQDMKLSSSRISHFFECMVNSETIGFRKPSREIFEHALQQVKADSSSSVMIGDNPGTDIVGARNAGLTPIFYNPDFTGKSDCEIQINRLSELMKIL